MKTKYIQNFTPMRGFICLLVMCYHLFCVSNNYYDIDIFNTFFEYAKPGLYMFFVISGFAVTQSFINNHYKIISYLRFLAKRFIRLHPTYLVVLFLGILYFVARNILFGVENSFAGIDGWQVLAHVFYVVNFTDYKWINIVFWTLSLEFQFYIFYGLLFPLLNKVRIASLILIIPALISLPAHTSIIGYLPYFVIGMSLCWFYNEHAKRTEFLIFSIILASTIFYINGILALVFLALIYICVFVKFTFKIRPLILLGKISYSLFLVHTLVCFAVINVAHKLPHTALNQVLCALVAISGSIFAAYVLNKFIEVPTGKISKKIKY